MYITSSNRLSGIEPSVTAGENINLDPSNVTDPDFSTLYIGTSNSTLNFEFGSVGAINYVAVAGVNIAGSEDFTSSISVLDGNSYVATTYVSMNNCVLITFTSRSFSNLKVNLNNAAGSSPVRVSYIAAGTAFEAPNSGEQSGYNRQFLNRSFKSKSTLNDIAAPIAFLTKKVSAKGSLSLPNVTRSFSESTWQDFLDFASSNLFFIREQDPVPEDTAKGATTNNNSAYLCFDLSTNKVTAHSKTRLLNNVSVSFKVFNGL